MMVITITVITIMVVTIIVAMSRRGRALSLVHIKNGRGRDRGPLHMDSMSQSVCYVLLDKV